MKILALDTSSKILAIGISEADKISEYNVEVGTRLSSVLVPSIKRVVDAVGWRIKDIDFFACGQGPGSFTGVRIGMAAVKALAWSLEKPIIAVSSLDILAENAPQASGFIVPVIDAKRGLVYAAVYKMKNDNLQRVSEYMLLSPEELAARVKKIIPPGSKAKALFLGDGLASYKERLSASVERSEFLDRDHWSVKAGNIIALAKEEIKRKKFHTAFSIGPVYLYPKECQVRKNK